MIACIAPPGTVFGHTATVEKTPWGRPIASALALCALFNSFPFDWLVRQKAATHLSLYMLRGLPVPAFSDSESRFLAGAALRLSCNHSGYDELWRDQAGAAQEPPGSALRAEIDAVVARCYGLDRSQYDHLLRAFSHRSRPEVPALCLAAFDRAGNVAGEIQNAPDLTVEGRGSDSFERHTPAGKPAAQHGRAYHERQA